MSSLQPPGSVHAPPVGCGREGWHNARLRRPGGARTRWRRSHPKRKGATTAQIKHAPVPTTALSLTPRAWQSRKWENTGRASAQVVPVVDLARWVRETFRPDDFVVLKRAPPRFSNARLTQPPCTSPSHQPDECASVCFHS